MFTYSINFATNYIISGVNSYKLKNNKPDFNRIAIKVGSNVITQTDGSLNDGRILRLVEDVAILYKRGTEVVLISSGAVAAFPGEPFRF